MLRRASKGNCIPHNILLISDAPDAPDAIAVRDALTSGSDGLFNVDWVRSWADGRAHLTRTAAAVTAVLADLYLADSWMPSAMVEGVEFREQLTCLRGMACPQGQGFYLSEPLTAAELSRLCRRRQAQTACVSDVSTSQAAG